ncbi:MAG TPA: VOC family protein [Cyclobacteriaceae bacterium]|nr:VOC family protein [Cyclobacteriaceae bacterium]
MDLVINGLQHVGIPVTDISVSVPFYERLGFRNVMTAPFEIDGEKGQCSMMQRNNFVLELYQMPPKDMEEVRKRRDGRIDHIAFDIPDVEVAMAMLRKNGFDVVESTPVKLNFWKNGVRFFFVLGPDGERLEFNQIL